MRCKIFHETSAYEDFGVQELFNRIVEDICERNYFDSDAIDEENFSFKDYESDKNVSIKEDENDENFSIKYD